MNKRVAGIAIVGALGLLGGVLGTGARAQEGRMYVVRIHAEHPWGTVEIIEGPYMGFLGAVGRADHIIQRGFCQEVPPTETEYGSASCFVPSQIKLIQVTAPPSSTEAK